MADYINTLQTALSQGQSIDEALSLLHSMGAGPFDAIKALRLGTNLDLENAKRFVSRSPFWAKQVQEHAELHEALIQSIECEKSPEPHQ